MRPLPSRDDPIRRCVMGSMIRMALLLAASSTLVGSSNPSRTLTFEDRVRAQEAIERVYYSYHIGATRTFEEAVPREILERKIHTYLKQSAALQDYWATPITEAMLKAELRRITRNTRFPDRLDRVFTALGRDPNLVIECFVRPVLVDRLARSFFASDQRI